MTSNKLKYADPDDVYKQCPRCRYLGNRSYYNFCSECGYRLKW